MYSPKDIDLVIQGTENMLTHAKDYYRNFFGYGEGDQMSLDPNNWSL
jgi:hypothetical protein